MTSAERSTKLICLMSTAVQLAHWTLRACFRSARYPPPPVSGCAILRTFYFAPH